MFYLLHKKLKVEKYTNNMKPIKHSLSIQNLPSSDGDFDAIVVNIPDTGDSTVFSVDRYRHTVSHGLGRIPVGCMVILSDNFVSVRVLNSDKNNINIQFDAARTNVNLRIW